MIRPLGGILKRGAITLAVLLPFVLPAQALGETLVFVNDTKGTVVVQVATVIRGAVRRGAPTTLGPGEKMKVTVPVTNSSTSTTPASLTACSSRAPSRRPPWTAS